MSSPGEPGLGEVTMSKRWLVMESPFEKLYDKSQPW